MSRCTRRLRNTTSQLTPVRKRQTLSLRIVEMLSQNGFSLRPTTLLHIHKELFHDIFDSSIPVVEYRTVNITKMN